MGLGLRLSRNKRLRSRFRFLQRQCIGKCQCFRRNLCMGFRFRFLLLQRLGRNLRFRQNKCFR
jgi:hypothetical protein